MLIRIYNARIWTGEHYIENGELWIEDGKIRLVSQVCPLIYLPWDREINAEGNLVMPSFKNAHAHSPMVFLRSLADDTALDEWLNTQIFPREAKLTADDCYWLTKLAVAEYVSGGISLASDMYFHLDGIAEACKECGFRNVILEGITEGNGPKDKLFKRLEWGMDTMAKMGSLIEYRLGLHAEYTNSEENVKAMAEFAKAHKMPVYTHLSETKKEVEECVARHGKTPAVYLAGLGLFDYGGIAYHCVHPTDDDIRALKEHNVSVVSCPASNLKLASGIAPLQKLKDSGINVGLGTDGPASNNCLDMFREMFLATGLQKAITQNPASMDGEYILKAATSNNAKAMGLSDLDTIEAGKQADLIMIDIHAPNMQPVNNVLKNVVYAGNKFNVLMTVIAGRIVYEKGEYNIGTDIEKIYSECDRIARRIIGE